MRRLIKGQALLVGLLWCGLAVAKVSVIPLADLSPNDEHRQTALIIAQVVTKFHYRQPELNDALSGKIYQAYLDALDANKSFFDRQELARYDGYRNKFDDSLRSGRLDVAFDMFRRFRTLVEQRIAYALQLLDANDFDFTRDEEYRFDRSKAVWAADSTTLDDLWRQRVKNDILSLRLAGKADEAVRETLRKRYEGIRRRTQQMNADDVFQVFINAFTLSIEPHTSYMSPRLAENFDIGMRLSLQGIGAVLRSDNEHTVIQSLVAGGPAARSGDLHPGDRIVGVGQDAKGEAEDVVGWRLQDVVDLIRGPKGSTVRLGILPKSEGMGGREREVVLVRDEIKLEDKAAKSDIVEGLEGFGNLRIGVIELPAFYRDFAAQAAGENDFRSTTRDVRQLLHDLIASGVDGIVIDLRQNGGGSLTEAVELTGLFIERGPVVQVKNTSGEIDVERDDDPEQVYAGPLAVLVDRNSASASEIFAGAIQDYRRGVVIGEPTYGKGTVQTLLDIGRFVRTEKDLGRLRLTMAQFFRIDGDSTQHRGVVPDIVFPTAEGAVKYGERALDNALPWAHIKAAEHLNLGMADAADLHEKAARRVAVDPGFVYLVAQEQEIMRMDKRDTVSLNEQVRRAEWDQREQAQLERRNRLRTYRGLAPLKNLNRDDEETVTDDAVDEEGIKRVMRDEAAHVLADAIHARRPQTAQTY